MICDKCRFEYEIGKKGEYTNVYGTRCPSCNHLIKPEQEPKFIRDFKKRKENIVRKYMPLIKEKLLREVEEEKCR